MSEAYELDRARALFKSFHQRDPLGAELLRIRPPAEAPLALEVGRLFALAYIALGDGKKYYHEFGGNKAKVYVTTGGRQIFLIGGNYKFTSRGFTG